MSFCTLKYSPPGGGGATTQTLAAWGLSGATLKLGDGGRDFLRLQLQEGTLAASPFLPFGVLEVFDNEEVRRFRGTVLSPARSASGQRLARTIVAAGPNVWLAGIPFAQSWEVLTEALVEEEEPEFETATLTISRLGRDTTPETIEDAVDFAVADGAPIDLVVTGLPGADDEEEEQNIPEDMQRGLSCLGVIEKMLGTHPYFGFRYEYEGSGDVALRFYSTLRPSHGIGDLPATPFAVEELDVVADKLETFECSALPELLVREMKVHFIEPQRVRIEAGRVVVGVLTTVTASGDSDAIRREEHTVMLRAAYWDGSEYMNAEGPKAKLAQQLIAPFKFMPHQARWTEKRGSPRWDRVPGVLYNFTGDDESFESAHVVLTGVEHDLRTGDTRSEAGQPAMLGTGQLSDLLRKLRRRNVPSASEAGEQTYGFKPDDDPPAADDPASQFVMWQRNQTTGELSPVRVKLRAEVVEDAEDETDLKRAWMPTDDGGYAVPKLSIIAKVVPP